jgi:cell division protein FtsB
MPPTAAATKPRSPARRGAKTRVHRRVSGPAKGAARPAQKVRAAAAAAAPALPRRRQRPAPAPAPRVLRGALKLRDSSMVGRLVRSQAWIGLLLVLLIGLVGINVSLLKLNAAAGRNAEWAKKLRVDNADLRARVSRLRSGQHIQAAARDLGLVMPAAASVHYLTADPGRDVRQALKRDTFTPPWSDEDVVSATPDPVPVLPAGVNTAAPAAAPGTTGAQGATGTTGVTPTATPTGTAPTVTEQPATGATGTQPSAQPTTGGGTIP